MTTLFLVFKKIEKDYKTKYDTFYLNSKTEIIINESDIDDVFQSIYTKIISSKEKSLGKVRDGLFSISKYNPLAGSNYIQL